MMKALVTGSTGFIGGALTRLLIERGHEVVAFHRPGSNLQLLTGLPVEHVLGDLTQPETLRSAMQGVEVVFHAAAQLGGGGRDLAGRMYAVTVEGTRSLLQAAKEAGVRRVVHTSSVAALGVPEMAPQKPAGKIPEPPPMMNEYHTFNLRPDYWPYGYAKYLAEIEVQKAVAQGLDCVIVNPSVVFGAGDVNRQESSVIMHVARRKIPFIPEGGWNAVHIADVVDGHLAALERGRCGERYILGAENLSTLEAIRRIAGVVKAPVPALVLPRWVILLMSGPMRLLDRFLDIPVSTSDLRLGGLYFYYDCRKAQEELGLPPPRPVDQAFSDAYAWFLANQ